MVGLTFVLACSDADETLVLVLMPMMHLFFLL